MSLQRRKKHLKVGAPEAVAGLLFALVLLPAVLWWGANLQPAWSRVAGYVVACDLTHHAYSQDKWPDEVQLTYAYTVNGHPYTGRYQGAWPQAHSPNAMPKQELRKLQERDFPVLIFYDPTDPAHSMLHYTSSLQPVTYQRLTIAALVLALAYFIKVYPAWRLHS